MVSQHLARQSYLRWEAMSVSYLRPTNGTELVEMGLGARVEDETGAGTHPFQRPMEAAKSPATYWSKPLGSRLQDGSVIGGRHESEARRKIRGPTRVEREEEKRKETDCSQGVLDGDGVCPRHPLDVMADTSSSLDLV